MRSRPIHPLVPILAACLLAAAPAPADDILADGGFEAGTEDEPNNPFWSEASSNFDSPICERDNPGLPDCDPFPDDPATAARTGTWFAWFGGLLAGSNGTSPEIGSLEQEVSIPADAGGGDSSATLRFFVKNRRCSDDPDDAADVFEVRVDGAPEFATGVADPSCGSTEYREETVVLDAYIGQTVTLQLRGEFHGDEVTSILVDDVSLFSCQYPANVVVATEILAGTETRSGCVTLTAGPAAVVASTADVTFEAPVRVTLRSGFVVESGGRLTVRAGG
jgi:hypothetical protein